MRPAYSSRGRCMAAVPLLAGSMMAAHRASWLRGCQGYLDPGHRQGYLDGMANSQSAVPGAGQLETLCCSFCIKDKDAVAKLIAGPGVYICNECVNLCDLILAEEPAPGFGSWNEQPDDELLASLARIQAVVSQ